MFSGQESDRPIELPPAVGATMAAVLRPVIAAAKNEAAHDRYLVQVLDVLPIAVWVCDASGRVTYFNRRAAALTRWVPETAGTHGFGAARELQFSTLIVAAEHGDPVAATMRDGVARNEIEVVLRRGDDTTCDASLTVEPLRTASGEVNGAVVTALDLIARKRRDRQVELLSRLSDQLATMTDEMEVIRFTTRVVGEYLGVQRCGFVENERGTGMLKVIAGWMREPLPSLAGRHDVQMLGDGEWQRAVSSARIAIDDVATNPHTRAFADYYVRRGVRAYAGAPFVQHGIWTATLTVTCEQPRQWTEDDVAVLEHVVARAWPLIERARSQSALQLITANAPVVLAYLDRDSRIVFANQAFVTRWSTDRDAVLGKPIADLIGDEAFAQIRSYVDRVLAGEPVEFEADLPYPRLGRRYVRISYAPDRDRDGAVRGYLAAVNDLTDRRAMEEAVRESEERFRALAQHAPVGIFQANADCDYTFVNAAWCRMAGLDAADAMGDGWIGAIHPDDRQRVLVTWQACARAGEPFACEHRFLRADSVVTWLQASAVPLRDAEGGVVGHIGTVVDITERKLAEFALRESEKRFRIVASRAPVGIFMADPNGDTVFVNSSWCTMAGMTPEEAQGRGWIQAMHPDDRERVLSEWAEAVRKGVSSKAEFRFVRRDGGVTWVHGTAVQLRDTNGRLTGYIGTVADFTERKEVELALRESEERFRMLADNIMQFAWICDPSGRLTWVNRRFIDYTGLDLEASCGGKLSELHHPDYVAGALAKFQQHLDSGEMWEDSFPLRGRDGTYRWFLSRAMPIREESGRIARWFGTNTDITDWRETQEQLRLAQQELLAHAGDLERKIETRTASLREAIAQMEEFSYSVSHDLRAPLRAMNAYAEALIEDYGTQLDETGRDYLMRIQRSSQRMEKLTHDVLTYSRLARAEIVLGVVDLKPILRDLAGQYAELQPDACDLLVEEPLRPVLGHELSLGQCLGNLLTNAAKFVAPGVRPSIRVFTLDAGEHVRVCVADNGIGIRPEHQRNLFQMFERVPTPTPYDGTGIGLAIVRKAVEKMGGRYGVESTGTDGSCFWVELPKPRT